MTTHVPNMSVVHLYIPCNIKALSQDPTVQQKRRVLQQQRQQAALFCSKNIYIYTYGVASKFGYGSARGDPDVWIGLDHLGFGMDRGYGSACGFRVWIGALHFDS